MSATPKHRARKLYSRYVAPVSNVGCPYCGQPKLTPCVGASGQRLSNPHTSRVRVVARQRQPSDEGTSGHNAQERSARKEIRSWI